MRTLILAALVAFGLSSNANGAFVTWTFGGAGSGAMLDFTGAGAEAGVSFSAKVTLGNALGVNQTATGVGVSGGADGNAINNGQFITVSAPTITSVSGGTVVFDSFSSAVVSGFDPGDAATIAGTPVSMNSTVGLGTAAAFNAVGTADGAPNPGFQLTSLTGSFTVTPTAVPEPSSMAALAFMGVGAMAHRRRRKAKKDEKTAVVA